MITELPEQPNQFIMDVYAIKRNANDFKDISANTKTFSKHFYNLQQPFYRQKKIYIFDPKRKGIGKRKVWVSREPRILLNCPDVCEIK